MDLNVDMKHMSGERMGVCVSRHTDFQSYILNLASNCGEYKCFNYFSKVTICCVSTEPHTHTHRIASR